MSETQSLSLRFNQLCQRPNWAQQSRARTAQILDALEAKLRLCLGNDAEESRRAREEQQRLSAAIAEDPDQPWPDHLVREAYDLSPFESDVLWLAAAPLLDPAVRHLLARVNNNILADFVDGALCLRVLCKDRAGVLDARSALGPDGRLFRTGLLRRLPRDISHANPLRYQLLPATHVVSFFNGKRELSEECAPYVDFITPGITLADLPDAQLFESQVLPVLEGFLTRRLDATSLHGRGGVHHPRGLALLLTGFDGAGRTLAIKGLAGTMARDLLVLEGSRLQHTSYPEAMSCIRTACQEAALYGEILVLRDADSVATPGNPAASALAEAVRTLPLILFLVAAPDMSLCPKIEQVILWRHGLKLRQDADAIQARWRLNAPVHADLDPATVEQLASKIELTPGQIRKALHLAYLSSPAAADPAAPARIDPAILETAARGQVSTPMGTLAEVSESHVTMRDLILRRDIDAKVREVIAAIQNRRKVLDMWRLRERIRRGYGITCLFDGEPGTGKSLSAEVIANEVGLTLLKVNVASVVDMYIGETEKNLTRIFSEVRSDVNLLLFDEADSLFSKRTEVSRSTDRYSNMEVNVLLQLIENYDGVTILTTNLKRAIDSAFERRITFKINFPMADPPERERLWRHFLPPFVPVAEEIDFEFLSTMELSGGEIKNAVLRAAYAAAERNALLNLDFLLDAARAEAASAGRLVRDDWG